MFFGTWDLFPLPPPHCGEAGGVSSGNGPVNLEAFVFTWSLFVHLSPELHCLIGLVPL